MIRVVRDPGPVTIPAVCLISGLLTKTVFMASARIAVTPVQLIDAKRFAEKHGVGNYLQAVLDMTERVFPEALRTIVRIEDDPELPNDSHLVVDVCLPALDASQYADAKFRWGRELFLICPAPVVCVFRCRLGTIEP